MLQEAEMRAFEGSTFPEAARLTANGRRLTAAP
jgi:hypothetical protein